MALAVTTFIWVVMISRIPTNRRKKSHIPCPSFRKSMEQVPGRSQIPDPVKIFIVFLIPTLYFGQIPDPENTHLDPTLFYNIMKQSTCRVLNIHNTAF